MIEDQLKKIPKEPGVYQFFDRFDRIIYIGKAINLRNRVRSYWNEKSWSERPKLHVMMPKVKRIETIITKTEKEALILEANLVFKHQPRYNVLLKDNKTFPWLVITYDEKYPRILPVRRIEKFKEKFKPTPRYAPEQKYKRSESKNKYFGPYTNVGAMWENLHLVHELFPLRRKKTPPFKNRPCLNYDLSKCLGPCQKLVSEEEYEIMLKQVEMLLNGDFKDLKDILEEEMFRHSEREEFEQAAKYRDRLKSLETFNEAQNVMSENVNLDQDTFVLAVDHEGEIACGQVFKTRAGKVVNRDTIEVEFNTEDTEDEMFESIFVQYYSKIPDSELPKEILLSHELKDSARQELEVSKENLPEINEYFEGERNNTDKNLQTDSLNFYTNWLSERRGSKVTLVAPKRGDKYAQIQLANKNAKVINEKLKLEQMEEASKNINVAIENLRKELDMITDPSRIECFDISHIQGSDTVASMVCFIDGLPIKDQYRKFKISVDRNNDFDAMREVIFRRYRVAKIHPASLQEFSEQGLQQITVNIDELPKLIIIDGGKGQVNAAAAIMKDLDLAHIKIVGLAKKEEEIYIPGESRPIILDRKSPELFLVQRIRNEAHRFAVSFHRQLRSKRALTSVLDNIAGLGPAKKKTLLDHFGTLKKVKEASIEEIASLKGFSDSLAQKIKDTL